MAKIDGGEMVVHMLLAEGITKIFTLHGGHVDPIFQACLSHNLRVIDFRHEQAAGHAADGFFRTTGRPAVCVVTAGPGVTDVVSAVANAHLDCIPMVVIGGKSPLADEDRLSLQDMDQLGLMRPITKWCRRVIETQRIPEYVGMALREATSGRPGPVFLEIPLDVLFGRVEENQVLFPQGYRPEGRPAASSRAVEALIELLLKAKRPLFLAGSGVWLAQACKELRALVERLGIPLFTNGMGRGAIPDTHPLCFGSFALLMEEGLRKVLSSTDLVVILGARVGLFLGGGRAIPPSAKLIQVDIAAEEIGRNRAIDCGIVGDLKETLRQIADHVGHGRFEKDPEWIQQLRKEKRRVEEAFALLAAADHVPIHPYRLAADIVKSLHPGAIIVADGGDTSSWTTVAAEVTEPGCWLSHGYLGCLGTGLPFAIAARLAHPDKQVVCITGDGSVGLNFMEFHTAVKHNLPFVTVISNDQAWGMCKRGQKLIFGPDRVIGTELGMVRYEKLVEDLGGYGEFVTQPQEIVPAFKRALDSGKVACLNVVTDPGAISPASYALMGREFNAGR